MIRIREIAAIAAIAAIGQSRVFGRKVLCRSLIAAKRSIVVLPISCDGGDDGDPGDQKRSGDQKRGLTMNRAFGFLTLIVVVAVGAYIYMRQTQNVMTGGTSTPTSTVDLIGVKNDLLAIAQAERAHAAAHGDFVSIDELRSQGDLSMLRNNRGPYTYSAEISASDFRIVATYSGPDRAMPKTISIDQSMQISQE